MFALALAAFLTFGFVSCQDKGSGPPGEDWQAMYEALSEEEQAKLGEGITSVVTSQLSRDTIVGSAFDSTYAMDAGEEELLFYVVVQVDTTGGIGELEKFGLELECLPWDRTRFALKATVAKVMSLAKVKEVMKIEAETDWQRAFRTLSEEEIKKLGPGIALIGISNITAKELDGSVFTQRWAIVTSGEEPLFLVFVTTDGSLEGIEALGVNVGSFDGLTFYASVSFPQIIAQAKLTNVTHIRMDIKRR